MTHVSKKKIEELIKIKELIKKYKVISIVDLTTLPSSNLQAIRNKLRDKIELGKVVKSTMLITLYFFINSFILISSSIFFLLTCVIFQPLPEHSLLISVLYPLYLIHPVAKSSQQSHELLLCSR